MPHLSGDKITRSHTTVTELAYDVGGFLRSLDEVTKISLGYITPINGRKGSSRIVKIIDEMGSVCVTMTQKGSVQDIRVYTRDRQKTKLTLARYIRDNGWELRFRRTY